jgi:hypothetical protein
MSRIPKKCGADEWEQVQDTPARRNEVAIIAIQQVMTELRRKVESPDEDHDKVWAWRLDEWADDLQNALNILAATDVQRADASG